MNQSELGVEKGYPERQHVADQDTAWQGELPGYTPPIHPDFETIRQRLEAKGFELTSETELKQLVTLSLEQIKDHCPEHILQLLHPLGRTGINGTGIFWQAGESATADMAIVRNEPHVGLQVALAFSRRWGLPGGFCDNEDEKINRRKTAIRETHEEVGLDLVELAARGLFHNLVPLQTKPNSTRSVDLGYITTQVESVLLPEASFGDGLKPGDDAEMVGWFTSEGLDLLMSERRMSSDHYDYAKLALAHYAINS